MPATVRTVLVKVGDEVAEGETLVVLEAMKMELPLRAPKAGRVAEIRCAPGRAGPARSAAGRTVVSRPTLPRRVKVVEVGPRDGLQNEQAAIDTALKLAVHRSHSPPPACRSSRSPRSSARSGCRRWPMRASVARAVARRPGVRFSALVPNRRGLERRYRVRARSRRRVRGRLRDVQPAQHQPVDCRLDAELRGADRGGSRARPRGPCLSLDVVRLPLRRPRARRTRRRAVGGAHRHGRSKRSPSATPSASPIPARSWTSSTQ